MAISKLLPLALLMASGCAWSREAALPGSCPATGAHPPISDLKTALAANTGDLLARFKLADAWSDAGCFSDALQVLEAGQADNPRNSELDARIRVAKSVLSEQTYFDKLDEAQQDAKLSRAVLRCSKLQELASCDDALSMRPGDPSLMMTEADTLMQLQRSGQAIGVYRRIPANAVNHDAVNAKLSAAEAMRRTQLDTCQGKEGDAAARACEFAVLPGSADEFAVFKRRGFLLQGMNQPSAALDAYLAAARLKPDDAAVAAAIVGLSSKLPPGLASAKREVRVAQQAAKHSRQDPRRSPTSKPVPIIEERPEAVASNGNSRYSNDAPATRSN